MDQNLTESPRALLEATLEVSVPLHDSIARFDEPAANYEIAAPCGLAFFHREGDAISHESSSPAPELLPILSELKERHLDAVHAPKGSDNSHLVPLLLMCMFLVDPNTRKRFSLETVINRPAAIDAITEEDGKHDPPLDASGDSALRAWVPLVATHAPEAGVHTAVLEMRWALGRITRYAPW